jgi:hypothetical protein
VGYYYFGWFPLATLSGFFLVLFFVQPLFQFLQVAFLQLFKRQSWRLEVDTNSVLVFRFETVGSVSDVEIRMVRWIAFLLLLAPLLYFILTMKGPPFVFALMIQVFWLCASSEDFRKL